ncbi:gp53-like domain-containing protein [Lonsdalea quercina]|uniref:gp53-like domain-containing protein n=1 Tax=Lonsdalea quercina TaxID=71657 RepID=UPI003974F454
MNRADAPKKQPIPFAVNGQREELLSKTPAGDNSASYDVGFPAVTMILKAAGGLPPKGQDMNQIIYELSSIARWFSAGGMNAFDSDFSTGIGGYPMGAVIIGDDGNTRYMNTVESNTSNPNSGGDGWFNLTSGYLKTSNNLSEVAKNGSAAVSAAQSNLGLGEAAKRGVGSGQSQIPDMSLFSASMGVNGWQKLPSGLIIQWGTATAQSVTANTYSKVPISFPIAFPINILSISLGLRTGITGYGYANSSFENASASGATWYYASSQDGLIPTVNYIALGY